MRKILLLVILYSISIGTAAQVFEMKGKHYLKYKSIDSTIVAIDKKVSNVKYDTVKLRVNDPFVYGGTDFVQYSYDDDVKFLRVKSNQVNKDTSIKCTYYFLRKKPIKIIAKTSVNNQADLVAIYYLGDRGEELYSKRDYDVSDLGDYYAAARKYLWRFIEMMLKSKVN